MAEESIGTARIDVIADTATAEARIKALERGVSQFGNGAAQQYNKASSSAKKYADSLTRQADLLGKSRAEQIAFNAQTRIGGELGDAIAKKALAQQAALSTGLGNTGKSVKELQFAMRGLPAQVSDIFISLQAGQRPLNVLLQQGSQLKDMFGGIGPAARALGSSLLGLVNPYTVAAAAVIGLAAAFVAAEKDQAAFANALITTGGYAGKTTTQLQAMVGAIAHTADSTQGTAREALQKVAETGRFTGEQFDLVVQAAAHMEAATGQSIDDTIKKFEEIGKAPVDALLKLNETEHFLTQAQLDRVRALVDEGNQQEAAAEAARIYATRLDDVATAAEAARPHLSQMWKEAKEDASSAWEATKNFAEFLAAASANVKKQVPWYQQLGPIGGVRAAIAGLQGAEPSAPADVKPVANAVESTQEKARIQLEKDAASFKDRYLTREQEKKKAIAELDKFRAQYTDEEYKNLKKQIELRFADKPTAQRKTSKLPDFSLKDQALVKKQIEEEGKLADERKRSEEATRAYAATLRDMLDTRQQAIDLQVASVGMSQKEIQQKSALIAIDEDYNRKRASLERQQRDTSSAILKASYQQQLDDLAKYHDERVRMEEDGWKRQQEAEADGLNGMKAAIADFMADQQNNAGQMYQLTSKFLGGFSDAFADFTSGAKSAGDAFGSLIDSMERDALKLLASKAMQAILDSFGLSGKSATPGSTAGGWASIAGNFINAYFGGGGGFGPGTIGAGLANGGPAAAGSIHPVVENGPELLTVGSTKYLLMGDQAGHVTPIRDKGDPARSNATYVTNINVQPTSTRRTADQIATANARAQRLATARNG